MDPIGGPKANVENTKAEDAPSNLAVIRPLHLTADGF